MKFNGKYRYLWVFILIVLYIFCLITLNNYKFNKKKIFDFYDKTSGWTLTTTTETKQINDLTEANLGLINDGDIVSISTTIPDLSHVVAPCLSFKSVLSTVDVYIDGELVYTYGHDTYDKGLMLSKSIHYINLDSTDSGKTVTITFMGTEPDSFSSFSNVYFGNIHDVYNNYIQLKKTPTFIGIFLCIFAFILLILSSYLITTDNKDYSIIFSSLISFILGAYLLGYNDIIILVSDNLSLGTNLEYIMLFYAPAAILGFIVTDNIGMTNWIFKLFLGVDLILPTILMVLHFLNIIHICNYIGIIHIFSMIEGIFCIFYLMRSTIMRNKKNKKRIEMKEDKTFIHSYSSDALAIGLLIFIGCATYDIFSFNLMKYHSTAGDRLSVSALTIGALTFVMALFLNFFFHSIDHFNSKAIFNKLENIAYSDELTGLSNRAHSDMVFNELEKNPCEYAIISIDLDHLKLINDTLGHIVGDRYLSNFANIIREIFINCALVARTGGDEFLIVIKNTDDRECTTLLSKFENHLMLESNISSEFNYEASYGYAIHTTNSTKTPHEIYMEADKQMYLMKQKHHNKNNADKKKIKGMVIEND